MTERPAQILVAGVGNSWLQDDGFGGEVVRRAQGARAADRRDGRGLRYRRPRSRLRGDARLRRARAARREPPGRRRPARSTCSSREEAEIAAGIEDGEMIDPHAMDPQTVLRFVRAVSAAGRASVVVIACEPGEVEEPGMGLTPEVAAAVDRARRPRRSRRSRAARPTRRRERGLTHARALAGRCGDRHGGSAMPAGRRVLLVHLRLGDCARWCPTRSTFYFEHVARGTLCEGARWSTRWSPRGWAATTCGHEWELEVAVVPLPAVRARGRRGRGGRGVRGRVDRGRGGQHAPREGPRRRGRARRQQHDRARQPRRLRPPRRGRRQPDGRARRRQDGAARAGARSRSATASASACSRATSRARSTPTGSPSLHVPVTQINTGAGFGGECHLDANMVRSALPSRAARRDRPARDRERRQPRLPGRVPRRRGRARDGRVGHRGRGQAAQVPADVPRVRARAGQQGRPAAAPRHRPRRAARTTSTPCIPTWRRMVVSARTGEGVDDVRRLAGRALARRAAAPCVTPRRRGPAASGSSAVWPRAARPARPLRRRGGAHRASSATPWPSASRAAAG